MATEISQLGIKFIQNEENFVKRAYYDEIGWAICFGNHYHPNGKKVTANDVAQFERNSPQANEYILSHLRREIYPQIKNKIKVQLSQNQFDSLCSFAYNVGKVKKELANAINKNNINEIRTVWLKYNKGAKSGYLKQLEERRKKELNYFLTGVANIPMFNGTNLQLTTNQNLSSNLGNLVIEIAKSQLGITEDPKYSDSGSKINTYLKSAGVSSPAFWCMAFVYWCYNEASKRAGIQNPLVRTGHCMTQWHDIRGAKKISPQQPNLIVPGAIFILSFGGGKGHTGIVVSVKDGYVNTIEGNTNDDGSRNGYGVFRRRRSIKSCFGFIVVDAISSLISGVNNGYSTGETSPPINSIPYTFFINTDETVNTLSKFIKEYKLLITEDEILNYSEFDNKESIYKSYSNDKKKQYKKASKEYLAPGTKIAIPFEKIKSGSIYSINQTIVENRSYNSFIEGEIKKIISDPDYKKLNIDNNLNNTIHKKIEHCKVWVWSKSLDFEGGTLTNITDFIENITTNVNENGGNFTITLPHIGFDNKQINNFDDLFVNYYNHNGYKNFVQKETTHKVEIKNPKDLVAFFGDSKNEDTKNILRRKQSFFNYLLQNNDLIFIRHEKIGLDKRDREIRDLQVPNTEIPNKVYDMIGLINNVSLSSVANGNSQTVQITGNDLSKAVIDDGVYFFGIEYAVKDREQIIINSTKSKSGNRLIIPPLIDDKDKYNQNIQHSLQGILEDNTFNFSKTQSIEEWLVFIFSQLSNIDIAPDSLFTHYKNKTFIMSREQDSDKTGTYNYKKIKANGIWQIIKLVVDSEIGNRRIADQSFVSATGSLLNLIRRVCQKPFVEFFMDTYGDKYYFICRKPPFSESSYKSNFTIDIFEDQVYQDDLAKTNEFYTWYRLNPSGSIIDNTNGESMAILPAVMLPEYMEIWGSKILDITTQYLDFDMSQSDQTQNNLDQIKKQGRYDLDWLIETHAYLPFTRQGTIVIKPDRRIKRGMNIRYNPTGEIFYVDGVSNTKQFGEKVNGMTTLQVSRGMVEKHYSKYFNVVNLLRNSKNSQQWDPATWTVNNEIFKFLLQSKQYIQ